MTKIQNPKHLFDLAKKLTVLLLVLWSLNI